MHKLTVALVVMLAACGGEEPKPLPLPSLVIVPTGLMLLPPGWGLHLYPGLCATVVVDAQDKAHQCIDDFDCTPSDPGRCKAFKGL